MLKVLKVYRYPSTGKLVAAMDHGNHVFPLNSDLTFSGKDPHRVSRRTRLELTPYRLEVEIQKERKGMMPIKLLGNGIRITFLLDLLIQLLR